jgi:hypothetical protein
MALERVGARGGWPSLPELAAPLATDGQRSSHALAVSLRRAVHGLERRGLVRTAYRPLERPTRDYWPLTLQVWLPGAESQVTGRLQRRRRWVEADAAVLRALRDLRGGRRRLARRGLPPARVRPSGGADVARSPH